MARCDDCIHAKVCDSLIPHGLPWNDGEYPAEKCCYLFKPTADVAPRAEFEALKDEADRYKRYYFRHDYDEMIAEAKAVVARELFEEIEKHLFVIAPIEEFDGWARIQLADIMRLKKKYTEPEPPEGD